MYTKGANVVESKFLAGTFSLMNHCYLIAGIPICANITVPVTLGVTCTFQVDPVSIGLLAVAHGSMKTGIGYSPSDGFHRIKDNQWTHSASLTHTNSYAMVDVEVSVLPTIQVIVDHFGGPYFGLKVCFTIHLVGTFSFAYFFSSQFFFELQLSMNDPQCSTGSLSQSNFRIVTNVGLQAVFGGALDIVLFGKTLFQKSLVFFATGSTKHPIANFCYYLSSSRGSLSLPLHIAAQHRQRKLLAAGAALDPPLSMETLASSDASYPANGMVYAGVVTNAGGASCPLSQFPNFRFVTCSIDSPNVLSIVSFYTLLDELVLRLICRFALQRAASDVSNDWTGAVNQL